MTTTKATEADRGWAREALLARLRTPRTEDAGRWTRDELYDDTADAEADQPDQPDPGRP